MANGGDNFFFDPKTQERTDPNQKRGVIARVGAAINAFLGKAEITTLPDLIPQPTTTEVGAANSAYASFNNPLWRVQFDRKSIYFDMKEMDDNDPLICSALDIHADCAVGYEDPKKDGFEWLLEQNNKEALQVLQDLKARLALGAEVWQIVRGFVHYGEEFREIVVDPDTGLVMRFKHLPSYQVIPNLDKYGNKQPGWKQVLDNASFVKPIEFEEWQICPFVYGARRGYFGTPLMLPARRTHKRLTKLEDGMVLARLVRAYDRYLHRIPVKPDWDMRRQQEAVIQYKKDMTIRKGMDQDGVIFQRDNPLAVPTDFFIPDDGTERGGIEALQAQNAQLQNIDDVKHHQELLLSRLKVPRKFLNLGSGKTGALMDGGLEAEDIQFARTLRQEQAVLRSGMMRLATLALMLQGFNAEELGLGIDLPMISTSDMLTTAKVQLAAAQAANFFGQALQGMPPEIVADKFMKLTEDEKQVLVSFIADEKASADKAAEADRNAKLIRGRPGGVEGNGANPEDVVQTVAKLKGLVQSELSRRYNIDFKVGLPENLRSVRQALSDEMSFDLSLNGKGR
jgi:hypothetical protein